MATIVEDIGSGQRFILLGAGYGMFQSARPNMILGDLFPSTAKGAQSVLAVCTEDGGVGWIPTNKTRVVSVDGQTPSEALA